MEIRKQKKKGSRLPFFSLLLFSFDILFDQEKKRSTHDMRQDQLEFHEMIAYANSSNYSSSMSARFVYALI